MKGFQSPNHTQTPNDLFDEYLPLMGEAELKVVMAIVRLTYGYQRSRVKASLSELRKATGLSKQGVLDGAHAAEKRGLIRYIPKKSGSEWVVNQVDHSGQPSRPPTPKSGQPSRPKYSSLNKELFKETIKESAFFSNSEFWAAWDEFEAHRREKRKPFTEVSAKRTAAKLGKYPVLIAIEALNTAVDRGWTGVFPESINASPNGKPKSAETARLPKGV